MAGPYAPLGWLTFLECVVKQSAGAIVYHCRFVAIYINASISSLQKLSFPNFCFFFPFFVKIVRAPPIVTR